MENKDIKRRSFKFLQKILSDYELNVMCRKICMMFLDITNGHPRNIICKMFWITEACYYECIKRSIVYSLVTDEEVDRIEVRTIYNQRHNADTKGLKTKFKYTYLRLDRHSLIEETIRCSQKKKEELTKKYAESKDGIFVFSFKQNIPYTALSKIVEEAIIKCYVEDDIVKKIQDKCLERKSRKKVIEQFKKYKQKREDFRSNTPQP